MRQRSRSVQPALLGALAARLACLFDPLRYPLAAFRVILEAIANDRILGPLGILSVAMGKSAQGSLGELEIGVRRNGGSPLIAVCVMVHNAAMPTAKHAALRLLRMKYKAANDAYQSCARALREAGIAGTSPSADLLERAAKAGRALDEARRTFMAGMSELASVRSGNGKTRG
jgi:hypothetical protein